MWKDRLGEEYGINLENIAADEIPNAKIPPPDMGSKRGNFPCCIHGKV